MNENQDLSEAATRASEPWTVDADAPLQQLLERPGCPSLVRNGLSPVLPWQTRNVKSVRNALASPRLAPQCVAGLLVLGARLTIGQDGEEREVALEAWLERTETGKVKALHVPPGGDIQRQGEAHVSRTPADDPIVAACAQVEIVGGVVRQARIGLTGVWPEPVRLASAANHLVGAALDDGRIQAVAAAVEEEVSPVGDYLGSEDYRRALAGILTRRVLQQCRLEPARERKGR
jgi:CO/xanthine dehydrogenase FAD-binding subunit